MNIFVLVELDKYFNDEKAIIATSFNREKLEAIEDAMEAEFELKDQLHDKSFDMECRINDTIGHDLPEVEYKRLFNIEVDKLSEEDRNILLNSPRPKDVLVTILEVPFV